MKGRRYRATLRLQCSDLRICLPSQPLEPVLTELQAQTWQHHGQDSRMVISIGRRLYRHHQHHRRRHHPRRPCRRPQHHVTCSTSLGPFGGVGTAKHSRVSDKAQDGFKFSLLQFTGAWGLRTIGAGSMPCCLDRKSSKPRPDHVLKCRRPKFVDATVCWSCPHSWPRGSFMDAGSRACGRPEKGTLTRAGRAARRAYGGCASLEVLWHS